MTSAATNLLDATVHKHLQIQEGKQRLEDILASLKDAFIALDPQQRYTYVNNNAAQMLGARKQGTRHWRCQDALLRFAHSLSATGTCWASNTSNLPATAMIGQNVWQHMTDVEGGIISRSLEKAMREEVDVVFDYHKETNMRWYVQALLPSHRVSSARSNLPSLRLLLQV
jgi:sensor histidine kinase regulating citrate/malate metabolism